MSVILGDDIIPRLSLHSVHSLKAEILKVSLLLSRFDSFQIKNLYQTLKKEIYNTDLPKYKIIWKYSISFITMAKENDLPISSDDSNDEDSPITKSYLDNSLNSQMSRNILLDNEEDLIQLDEESLDKIDSIRSSKNYDERQLSRATAKAISEQDDKTKFNRANSARSNIVDLDDFRDPPYSDGSKSSIVAVDLIKKMMHHVKQTYPDLYLPGNILYIYRIKAFNANEEKCWSKVVPSFLPCCRNKNTDYDSRWASRDEFRKILVTRRMLIDHFPNTVTDALEYFHSTNRIHA